MKVSEFREIVKNYSKEEADFLLVQLYKLIPRRKVEDYQVDEMLKAPGEYLNKKIKIGKSGRLRSAEEVETEVLAFIKNVKEGYYKGPNKVIPKRVRSGWRNTVKDFYKDLSILGNISETRKLSLDLLEELYFLLDQGSLKSLFPTRNTFGAIKLSQMDFFVSILEISHLVLDKKEYITRSVKLIMDSLLNNETTYTQLIAAFLNTLKIPDNKYLAIETALLQYNELNERMISQSISVSHLKLKMNILVEIAFRTYCELGDFEQAIEVWDKRYWSYTREIALFEKINYLLRYKKDKLVLEQINKAISEGMNLRWELLKLKKDLEKE